MAISLDVLQQRWAAQDHKLDQAIALNTRVLREIELGRAERPLASLRRGLSFELAMHGLSVPFWGAVLGRNLDDLAAAIASGVLLLGAIALLGSGIYQLVLSGQVDFAESVTVIQRRLAALRTARLRSYQAVLLLAPLFWVPFYLALIGLIGFGVSDFVGTPMFYANTGFGLVWLAGGAWAARRWGDRLARTPLVRELIRNIGGRSLRDVSERVDAIAAFEREGG